MKVLNASNDSLNDIQLYKMGEWHPFTVLSDRSETELKNIISNRILGSCLGILGNNMGEVELYNISNGDFLYKMNTHMIYRFPRNLVREAIQMELPQYQNN